MTELTVLDQKISYFKIEDEDYISITDMLKSKDGNFFVSDWLFINRVYNLAVTAPLVLISTIFI